MYVPFLANASQSVYRTVMLCKLLSYHRRSKINQVLANASQFVYRAVTLYKPLERTLFFLANASQVFTELLHSVNSKKA